MAFMPAPKGFGNAGRALWASIRKTLQPHDVELDERDLAVLTLACRQADDLARLEVVIAKQGVMAKGSTGQPVVHPAVQEARQARQAVQRALAQLELPVDEDTEAGESAASRRARRAAEARWRDR